MNKKGFTLIELLATITIMALILLMVIPAISALQKNNKTKPYEYYADSLVEAAKIYVLRENEDLKNMGTENWEGCIEISYQDLLNSDLIKPYQDEEVDCSNAVIRYNRIESENISKYTYNMTCVNTSDNSVLYEHQGIDGSSCSFKAYSSVVDILLKNNPVKEALPNMFNYTSEGRYDYSADSVDATYITNGLYMMEDDDGPSYYFRGNVDNIVQFGTYEEDYYVYQNEGGYQTQTLESCQRYNNVFDYLGYSQCNQVVKYTKGTPMYFRIVRVNGDGTLRLLYSGTSSDATNDDVMVGVSHYNTVGDDKKYTGYTYDNGVDSLAKKEVDTWYTNALSNSTYDNYLAYGSFCSDSSGYDGEYFATYNRYVAGNPTLKCPTTTENFGGNYTLKAGLMTIDELMLSGDSTGFANGWHYTKNYLSINVYDSYFWTMSPWLFETFAGTWNRGPDRGHNYVAATLGAGIRPVINVDVSNLTITGSGTTTDPYVLK